MVKIKLNLHNLSLRTITLIQVLVAATISLFFQILIPFSWQPLDAFLYGIKQHGDPGTNFVIFTLSQWYFSLSIAWFIYRDNPYINNFLIYSVVPLGIIIVYEFFFLFFYYDYVHITPVIIDFCLIWKRRETLYRKFAFYVIPFNISWLISVYFLKLAYYNEVFLFFIRNILIYLVLWILLAFLFNSKSKNI